VRGRGKWGRGARGGGRGRARARGKNRGGNVTNIFHNYKS